MLAPGTESISKMLKTAHLKANFSLGVQKFDSKYSGTTCCSVIVTPSNVICSNVGDSRAIIGRKNTQTNNWEYLPLSKDHKPEDLKERS